MIDAQIDNSIVSLFLLPIYCVAIVVLLPVLALKLVGQAYFCLWLALQHKLVSMGLAFGPLGV